MFGATSFFSYMGILAILYTTMRLRLVDAAIGYDCNTKQQYKTVPFEDKNYCDMSPAGVKVSTENIAVLQINEYKEAIILQCKIEIRQVINNCLYVPLNFNTKLKVNSTREYIYPISYKACQIAHDHGTMIIGKTTISGLRMDGTTTHSVVLAGSVDFIGCTGEKYSDPYGTWNDVVVLGTADITLRTHLVKADIDRDSFELPSGYRCRFSKGECVDSDGGYTFIDKFPLRYCSDRMFSVLYNGRATKLKSDDERIYSVMVSGTRLSFVTIGNETLCGATVFKTDFPELFIVENKDMRQLEKIEVMGNDTNNLDIFQYEHDKSVYTETFTRYPMHYLYKNVMEHKCKRVQTSLKTALANASTHPDEFAFQYMGGPGYMAIIEKDRFHILQCVPMVVKLQQQDKCYDRLPILRGNQRLFLTPWTRIITDNATELPCNSPLLQYHVLDSITYKVLPKPPGILEHESFEPKNLKPKRLESKSFEPKRLKPSTGLTWQYQELGGLATGGIYKEDDIRRAWENIQHPQRFYPQREVYVYPEANRHTPDVTYLNSPYVRGRTNSPYVECLLKKFPESRNIFSSIFSCV